MKPGAAFIVILGAIPVALTLVQRGVLTVGQAAGLLLTVVIGLALTAKFLRLALPVFAFLLFVTYNAHGIPGELRSLIAGLLALAVALFGLYVIARGVTRKKGRRGEDD